MRNIKLTIAYDGTKYAGWQRQTSRQSSVASPQSKTIQETIEKALQKILRERIHLTGSGRTDAGVHAVGQVANFKTVSPFGLDRLKTALNGVLPCDIAILKAEDAAPSFHSRFDARSKIYRYIIVNQPTRPAFVHSLACWVRTSLDIKAMRRESRCLLGRHDFRSFQSHDRARRKSVTTVLRIDIRKSKAGDGLPFFKDRDIVMIDIGAEGFLRNMARNMIGTLLEIGKAKMKHGSLAKILKAKDRRAAGPCAPARGLYLLSVRYE